MQLRTLKIRRATAADIPALVDLWSEYAEHHRKKDPIFAVASNARVGWSRWMRKLLRTRKTRVFIAELGGRAVGFCTAQVALRPPVMKNRKYGAIFDFAVTQACRRKGVGRSLFVECKNWFLGLGLRRLELRVVPRNPEAAGFWRRMGLRPYVEVHFLEL